MCCSLSFLEVFILISTFVECHLGKSSSVHFKSKICHIFLFFKFIIIIIFLLILMFQKHLDLLFLDHLPMRTSPYKSLYTSILIPKKDLCQSTWQETSFK